MRLNGEGGEGALGPSADAPNDMDRAEPIPLASWELAHEDALAHDEKEVYNGSVW